MKIRNYEKDRQNTIKYSVGSTKYIEEMLELICVLLELHKYHINNISEQFQIYYLSVYYPFQTKYHLTKF